jgi:hypothetical protein
MELMKACDLGVLLGDNATRNILNELISILACKMSSIASTLPINMITVSRKASLVGKFGILQGPVITRLQPSILDFFDLHFQPQLPVVLQGCMLDWPALSEEKRRWSSLQYVLSGKSIFED